MSNRNDGVAAAEGVGDVARAEQPLGRLGMVAAPERAGRTLER